MFFSPISPKNIRPCMTSENLLVSSKKTSVLMWNSNLKATYISVTEGFFRTVKSWLEKVSNLCIIDFFRYNFINNKQQMGGFLNEFKLQFNYAR